MVVAGKRWTLSWTISFLLLLSLARRGTNSQASCQRVRGRVSQLLSIISGVAVVLHKLYEFNQSEHLQKEWSW